MIHEWQPGATILSAKLAVCKRCGGLRVTEGGRTHYIVRTTSVRDERVFDVEPATCAPPARRGSIGAW